MRMNCFKIFTVGFVLMLALLSVHGQNYIGMHKDDIAKVLKQQNPDFRIDNSVINNTYHYLKFEDKISEQTILFFLSEDDVCKYVRWISDYANLNDMMGMLNREYRPIGDKTWTYSHDGKIYTVRLEEEKWYFTVNIREE